MRTKDRERVSYFMMNCDIRLIRALYYYYYDFSDNFTITTVYD